MGSTIAEGTVIKGRISGDGDLEVHGHVEGSIEVAGELTVGATGLVKSDLRARRLTVSGAVRGDLHATEAVVLEPGARVVGDLVAPSVGVREGALVRGRITTGTPAEAGLAKAAAREHARVEAPRAAARPAARPEPVRAVRPVAVAPSARPAPRVEAPAKAAPAPAPAPAPAAKQPPPAPVVPALKRRTEKVKRKGS